MFSLKLWNLFLGVIIIFLVLWICWKPDTHATPPSFNASTSVEVLNAHIKELQDELRESDKEKKRPSLEDIGVWIGIGTLVVTLVAAAGGILLAQTYVENIAEKVARKSNLLITGRTHGAMAMMGCHLQWIKTNGYERNTTIDLKDWIISEGNRSLAAFEILKNEKFESADVRKSYQGCMNNLLFAYALADDKGKYGLRAAALLSGWKTAFTKERKDLNHRLTEIRVEVTYPEYVFGYSTNSEYRNQLIALRTEINLLASTAGANQSEIATLLQKLEESFRRFPIN